MVFAGIDVAKDSHQCVIVSQSNEILQQFSFSNSNEGFNLLFKTLTEFCKGDCTKVKIGLEATGHYSSNLLFFLVEKGFQVVILNPLRVSNSKKAHTLRRTKTDKSDALYIAELMLIDKSKPYVKQDYHISELKSITRARFRLSNELQSVKGKFRYALHIVFPEYPQLFGALYRGASLDLLAAYPSAKEIASLHLTTLINFLISHSHGVLRKEKAIFIKQAAKNSIGTYSAGTALELKMLTEQILFMQRQCKLLEERIDVLMKEINSPITSIPGIGNYLGGIILSEIGDINNFDSPSKLQAFAGAEPAIYQSGKFSASNTPMVKRGSSYLRHALYLATCMASFSSPTFAKYIDKKKAQGKHHYVAIAHGMKKMIRVIFSVLKNNKPYIEPTF